MIESGISMSFSLMKHNTWCSPEPPIYIRFERSPRADFTVSGRPPSIKTDWAVLFSPGRMRAVYVRIQSILAVVFMADGWNEKGVIN